MKLRRLRIQGFRSIKDLPIDKVDKVDKVDKDFIDVDDFLCFIGANNCGKSNIFYALDLFFSSTTRGITSDIFYRSPTETASEVIIEARFEDLSDPEMEKLGPWAVGRSLTVSKKYWIDDSGKPQVSYEALMKVPREPWLSEDYTAFNNRDAVSQLPIAEFLPESGRITKQIYKDAIQKYLRTYPDKVEFIEDRRVNPAGYKQVLDGYLPEFYLVPAVREVTEETKTTGTAFLSKILDVIISRIARQNPTFQHLQDTVQEVKKLIEGETPEDKLAEIRELEGRLIQELGPWDVGLSIGVEAPDIEKVFQLGTSITLNDGIPTSVSEKGHGLQRYLV